MLTFFKLQKHLWNIPKIIKFIQFILGLVIIGIDLIFIGIDQIKKIYIQRPIISYLLIFLLWVSSLPLPEKHMVTLQPDSFSQLETTIHTRQALGISGGKWVPLDPVVEGVSSG